MEDDGDNYENIVSYFRDLEIAFGDWIYYNADVLLFFKC